jgi:hypothetical protein
MSRSQMQKLGERLAASAEVSDADHSALEEITACHLQALEDARPRLDGLDAAVGTAHLNITHRPKWATADHKEVPAKTAVHLDQVTAEIWAAVIRGLHEAGIDM